MKKSKLTNSNEAHKILRMISRNDEFERNGGGQWVAKDRPWKNKKKYNRKDSKREFKGFLNSLFLFRYLFLKKSI